MKWLFVLVCAGSLFGAEEINFNRDIRPILSDKCFHCHGPDPNNRKAGLRLDEATTAQGKKAILPGDAAASNLIKRVTHSSKALRMPPAYAGMDALPAADIEKLRKWIDSGAKYEGHWSFLPPRKQTIPVSLNPVDHFIREKLQTSGLKPSPPADKPTLLRRVSFDLTGLPPTPAELDAYLKDNSPKAYEKQVDRLLASPRYAERMAWRWLEAARYADTNGYQSDGVRDMFRWRDWVIESFHRNQPFDRFIVEQIAGDLLPSPTLDQKIATAFHRNHRTSAEGGIVPEEFRTEYVADRAETTSTVFLGLTMGCARCHDHKYDPITQKDFYRLFAFFNNVPEKGLVYNFGNDEPLIPAPTREQAAELARLSQLRSAAEAKFEKLEPKIRREQDKWTAQLAAKPQAWLPAEDLVYESKQRFRFDGKNFEEVKPSPVVYDYLTPFTFSAWVNPKKPDGAILGISEDYDEGNGHALLLMKGKLRVHVVFRWTDIGMRLETEEPLALNDWQHVAVTYDGSRYAKGVQVYINGQPRRVKILFDELNFPMNFKHPLRIGAGYGLRLDGEVEDIHIYKRELNPSEVISLFDRAPLSSGSRPEKLRLAFFDLAASPEIRQALQQRREARDAERKFAKSLPTVMVMQEGPKRQAHLLKRGAYDAPGEPVDPGTPGILPPMPDSARQDRLGLAEWLVNRENPLTARVTVNRFWQMIFGVGLVKTVEDFGSQGEWPTHQALLDQLSVEFMESGWDVKALLKKIVTSDTYRQSSRVTPELQEKDPENRLLARAPRTRLAPEMIRDNALAVSGLLVDKQGGPSVKPYQPPGLWQELFGGGGYIQDHGDKLYRRSLYTFWKRTIAPPNMTNFDSPSRETCTVRENRTNTPLQALTLMNETGFLEASRKLAERLLREAPASADAKFDLAYRLVLSRSVKPQETTLLRQAFDRALNRYQKHPKDADALLDQGESPLPRKYPRPELAAWTTIANLILNLDEAVTKQ